MNQKQCYLMDDPAVGNTDGNAKNGNVRVIIRWDCQTNEDLFAFEKILDDYCEVLQLRTPSMALGELTKEQLVEFIISNPQIEFVNMVNF